MNIKGKVHCMFEQSGTFKNEFIKLGIPAEDYDIQNNFGKTDNVIDLFAEIEKGYEGQPSIFDNITPDDLIVAFFPCIYFTGSSNPLFFNGTAYHLPILPTIKYIIKRNQDRAYFYELLMKLCYIVYEKGLRLIFENPYDDSMHYLKNNFLCKPAVYDKNRSLRGDYFKKPTGFWYINCEPTYGESIQPNNHPKVIRDLPAGKGDGLCSEERSMISPDYARNFICDFIIGKQQDIGQLNLF
jgi:hypothetical protein